MLRMGKNHFAILLRLYLKKDKRMLYSEARKITGGPYYYTESILLDLKKEGLITEKREGRRRWIVLTKKGEEIARFFYERAVRKMEEESA